MQAAPQSRGESSAARQRAGRQPPATRRRVSRGTPAHGALILTVMAALFQQERNLLCRDRTLKGSGGGALFQQLTFQ